MALAGDRRHLSKQSHQQKIGKDHGARAPATAGEGEPEKVGNAIRKRVLWLKCVSEEILREYPSSAGPQGEEASLQIAL